MEWNKYTKNKEGYLYGSGRPVINGNPEIKRIIKATRGITQ